MLILKSLFLITLKGPYKVAFIRGQILFMESLDKLDFKHVNKVDFLTS